jgi:hypothetical protein
MIYSFIFVWQMLSSEIMPKIFFILYGIFRSPFKKRHQEYILIIQTYKQT